MLDHLVMPDGHWGAHDLHARQTHSGRAGVTKHSRYSFTGISMENQSSARIALALATLLLQDNVTELLNPPADSLKSRKIKKTNRIVGDV